MTLEMLIIEADDSGWAVTLRQHPDRAKHWECQLSRPHPEPRPYGIIREIIFAIHHNPIGALDRALDQASSTEPALIIPSGCGLDEPPVNLLTLLNLQPAARPLPTITRR